MHRCITTCAFRQLFVFIQIKQTACGCKINFLLTTPSPGQKFHKQKQFSAIQKSIINGYPAILLLKLFSIQVFVVQSRFSAFKTILTQLSASTYWDAFKVKAGIWALYPKRSLVALRFSWRPHTVIKAIFSRFPPTWMNVSQGPELRIVCVRNLTFNKNVAWPAVFKTLFTWSGGPRSSGVGF